MADTRAGTFERVRAWLELLSFAAVAIGIVLGFTDHFAARAQARRDVVEAVYNSLDAEYRDYLTTLVTHPRLASVHRPPSAPVTDLTPDERTQQRVLHGLLIDLYERAYLEHNDPEKLALMRDERRAQWDGWVKDIDRALAIADVRALWNEIGDEFDARFQAYVTSRLAQKGKRP